MPKESYTTKIVIVIIALIIIIGIAFVLMQEKPKPIVEPPINDTPVDNRTDVEKRIDSIKVECEFGDYQNEDSCIDDELFLAAQYKKDEVFCEAMSEGVQECIDKVMAKKLRAEKDLKVCDAYSGDRKNNCIDLYYMNLAFDENDIKHCENIKDEWASNECNDNLLWETALSEKNCSLLKSDFSRNDCKSNVEREILYEAAEEGNCESLDTILLKDNCYGIMAENSNNIELCQEIIDEEIKTYCIELLTQESE